MGGVGGINTIEKPRRDAKCWGGDEIGREGDELEKAALGGVKSVLDTLFISLLQKKYERTTSYRI